MLEPAGESERTNPHIFWAGFVIGFIFCGVVVMAVVMIVEAFGF